MEEERRPNGSRIKTTLPRATWHTLTFIRFAVARFWTDNLLQAAAALTYSTLLALVPLLVLTVAILSGFPAFDAARQRMTEIFFDTLVPEVGAEVESYLFEFTANASNLTAIGVVALAVTAILLLWSIEFTLNSVWRVKRQRPIAVRILIYWTILTLGPLLLGASVVLTNNAIGTLLGWARDGVLPDRPAETGAVLNTAVALVAQSLAFTLLFKLVPARPVRLREAALGGAFSGVAFELLGWAFNSFLTSGSTYETIYGAVAIFPIFLIWLYSSWTVIILGAVLAASFPDWSKTRDALPPGALTPAHRLAIAIALLGALLRQSRDGGSLAVEKLHEAAPLQGRDDVLERLRAKNFVVMTEDEEYCLARDLNTTTVTDLAESLGLLLGTPPDLGGQTDDPAGLPQTREHAGSLETILQRLHNAEAAILDMPIAAVVAGELGVGSGPQPLEPVPQRAR